MNGRLSAFLGAAVGLALAAALLLPDADRDALLAQGVGHLLSGHLTVATDGPALPAEGPPTGLADTGAAPRSIFELLDERLDAADEPSLGLDVRIDGEPRALGERLVDDPFVRAFNTQLNLFQEARITAREDAHAEAVAAAEEAGAPAPAAPTPPTRPFIVAAGDDPALTVQLDVHVDDDDAVRLTAVLEGDGWLAASVPPEGAWRLASGADPSTVASLPGRAALIPPLLAIVVALLMRKTLLALFVGILAGAVLLARPDNDGWAGAITQGLGDVFTVYFWQQLTDTFRFEIIGFVIALVAMVGVMSRSGGVQGLVDLLVGYAKTVRSTLMATWGMGILIFFDDYANCLLVGNTMRPLTDRLRISREKLAYIVDSTAAPIAGVSLLSTWIAFEVSTYQAHLPGAGITENAYAIFLQTIPFRYYCIFTLAFVFLSIVTGRDYGPMAKAEARARTTGRLVREGGVPMVSDEASAIQPYEGMPHVWWKGAAPITLVLLATMGSIFYEGGGLGAWSDGSLFTLEGMSAVLFDGSGGKPIFVGASLGFVLAVFLSGSSLVRAATSAGVITGALSVDLCTEWLLGLSFVQDEAGVGKLIANTAPYAAWGLTVSIGFLVALIALRPFLGNSRRPHLPGSEITAASLSSIKALFFAVIILFEAWMIGEVCARLDTADYLVALLSGSVSAVMLPVLLFVAACLVAFATGSSWSTMSILLPNVVALAAAVGESEGLGALGMVVLCIGAVLEGSIFGDHCSPISDTTVLSSVSSASDHVDHVRTQAPYALTTGALAIALGYVPTVLFDWWTTPLALSAGVAAILVIQLGFGRKAPDAPAPDAAVGAPSTSG